MCPKTGILGLFLVTILKLPKILEWSTLRSTPPQLLTKSRYFFRYSTSEHLKNWCLFAEYDPLRIEKVHWTFSTRCASLRSFSSYSFSIPRCNFVTAFATSHANKKRTALLCIFIWCLFAESNHGHRDFQSLALPTELNRQIKK